jgi:hypothetical protein
MKYQRDLVKLERLKTTALKSRKISEILFAHADKQIRLTRIIRFLNFIVGAAVAYLSLTISSIDTNKALALTAALFIFADTGLPLILGEPNPERFKDYATYIEDYGRILENLEIDDELESLTWNSRAMELINLTQKNIDDVLGKWPWIKKKVSN